MHTLDQYGAIVEHVEGDINAGHAVEQADGWKGHFTAGQSAATPAVDMDKEVPVTMGAWVTICQAIHELQKRLAKLELRTGLTHVNGRPGE